MPDRRDDILAHVNHPNYRPVKPKVIARKLGAEGHEATEAVRKTIKRLAREGLLAFGASHAVYPLQNQDAPPPSSGAEGGGDVGGARTSDELGARGAAPGPAPHLRREGTADGESQPPANPKQKRDRRHVVGTFRRAEAGFGFVRPEGTAKATGRDADIFIPAKYTAD
ncbi:MAG TPA: hypothetical protein VEQ85_05590, partial [Lacipirellulaceae bacterium]|nr:hypothetical protein [Lacipirellulaceae bacterium]